MTTTCSTTASGVPPGRSETTRESTPTAADAEHAPYQPPFAVDLPSTQDYDALVEILAAVSQGAGELPALLACLGDLVADLPATRRCQPGASMNTEAHWQAIAHRCANDLLHASEAAHHLLAPIRSATAHILRLRDATANSAATAHLREGISSRAH